MHLRTFCTVRATLAPVSMVTVHREIARRHLISSVLGDAQSWLPLLYAFFILLLHSFSLSWSESIFVFSISEISLSHR